MVKQVVIILDSFGYTVGYSPYHTDADIKKYASKKDRVSGKNFFTVYSPDGYVVGRIHDLEENDKFKISHLKTIISYFKMFEISNSKAIVIELERILDKSKKK